MTARARKRVCFLVPTHWDAVMGGAQYQAKVLFERMLATCDYDMHFLGRRLPDQAPEDHTVHKVGHSRGADFVFDLPLLLRTLRRLQPDTLYHQVGSAYTGAAAWHCRRSRTRLVWHIASDVDVEPWKPGRRRNLLLSYADKKLLEYGVRRADAIVGQTEHQARLLEQHYGRQLTALVKNFHPVPPLPICKSTTPTVVWIANLKNVKQPDAFIELARSLSDEPIRFVMIGGMQFEEREAAALQARIDATPNLTYTGPIPQDAVNQWLLDAHLLVNTSRYEGFSNTFIQAWLREVPVCSLNVDPDRLLSGEQALGRCAAGDPQQLASQVAALLNDAAERQRIGERSRRYAEAEHGIANADRLLELF